MNSVAKAVIQVVAYSVLYTLCSNFFGINVSAIVAVQSDRSNYEENGVNSYSKTLTLAVSLR